VGNWVANIALSSSSIDSVQPSVGLWIPTFSAGAYCFRCFFLRSINLLNAETFFIPAEPEKVHLAPDASGCDWHGRILVNAVDLHSDGQSNWPASLSLEAVFINFQGLDLRL
jgi:hypothetical protein